MKPVIPLLTLFLLGVTNPAEAAEPIGFRTFSVPAPERGANLTVHVWYPADQGGTPTLVGDNLLFRGTMASAEAPIAVRRAPLVLLSHGSGGNAPNLGWLASRLAAEGFLVAAPNHPGSTTGDASQGATIQIWSRPADISALVTAITTDPRFSAMVDPDKIGVIGFSLGGHTALALAGAQTDAEAYARYCAGNAAGPECAWFVRGGVDLRAVDKERFNRSNRDTRIKAAIAIDPALAQAYRPESLAAISIPTHIINLGRPGWIIPAVEGFRIAQAVPKATYEAISDATHFSFLGECKPEGLAILKSEGDEDPLCDDGGTRPRKAIHAQLAEMIAVVFRRHLQDRP